MTWFFAFLIVAVLGVVAVVASGRGGSMAEVYDDRPDSRVQADGPLTSADIRGVRFSTAFRGYRMSEVDALLDRLAAELDGLRVGPMDPGDRAPSAQAGGDASRPSGPVDRAAGLGWPEAPGLAASTPATSRPRPGGGPVRRPPAKKDPDSVDLPPEKRPGGDGP